LGLPDVLTHELIPEAAVISRGEVYALIATYANYYCAHYKIQTQGCFKHGGKVRFFFLNKQ